MGLVSIDPVSIFFNIANVLIFFAIVKIFFWKPVTAIMEKREQMIKSGLDEAEANKEEAQKLKQQYEEALSDAKQEAAGIVEKARKRSQEEHDAAVAKTQSETSKMLEDARTAAELERSKAMKDMQAEIAGIAMAAAQKVVQNNINDEANRKYLDDFLGEAGGKK